MARVNNTQEIKNIFGVDINSSSNGKSTSTIPDYMTMGGSLFNAPGVKKSTTKEASNANADIADATSDTNNAKNETQKTESSTTSAQGWTAKCKEYVAKAADLLGIETADSNKIKNQGNKAVAEIAKNNKEVKQLSKENEKTNAEIESLQAEKESLGGGDATGSGTKSAFSLALGGVSKNQASGNQNSSGPSMKKSSTEPDNQKQTAETAEEGGNENSDKIAEIDSQIEGKSATVVSNNSQIKTTTASTTTKATLINNLTMDASKAVKSHTETAKAGIDGANTAQTVGTMTSAIGGTSVATAQVLNTTGISLIPNPVTTAAGTAEVTVAGVMNTAGQSALVVGAATSAGAQIAGKNWAGLTQSAQQLANSANSLKSKAKEVIPENKGKPVDGNSSNFA